MIKLEKGSKIDLKKASSNDYPLETVVVGLGWSGINGMNLDLDSYVGTRDKDGNPIQFIYFGHKNDQGILHNGDDLVGGGLSTDPNETIEINLNSLPSVVKYVEAGLFIFSGASDLRQVDYAFVNIEKKIQGQSNEELVRYTMDSGFVEMSFGRYAKSVVAGKFIREDDGWKFEAIGETGLESYRDVVDRFRRRVPQEPNKRGFLNSISKLLK